MVAKNKTQEVKTNAILLKIARVIIIKIKFEFSPLLKAVVFYNN